MSTIAEDKIITQTQSLNYILHHLAKLRKVYATLQATYSFSTDTHFLLLKPVNLFEKKKFIEAIGQIILEFYQLFPDEGIVLTEKDDLNTLAEGANILQEDGFHLPVDLMAFVSEVQKPKIIEVVKEIPVEVIREVEVIKEVPVEIVREVEVIKGIDFELLQEMMKDVPNITIKKQK